MEGERDAVALRWEEENKSKHTKAIRWECCFGVLQIEFSSKPVTDVEKETESIYLHYIPLNVIDQAIKKKNTCLSCLTFPPHTHTHHGDCSLGIWVSRIQFSLRDTNLAHVNEVVAEKRPERKRGMGVICGLLQGHLLHCRPGKFGFSAPLLFIKVRTHFLSPRMPLSLSFLLTCWKCTNHLWPLCYLLLFCNAGLVLRENSLYSNCPVV